MPKHSEPEPPPSADTSVVIVSRNQTAALRQCLAALEASPARPTWEVVCVDNGSQDGIVALEAEFPQVKFLKLPRNFGKVKALNIGLRSSDTEYVLFLEPETIVAGDTIPSLREALSAESAAVAVGPLLVSESGQPVPELGPLPDRFTLFAGWPSLALPPLAEPVPLDQPVLEVPYASLAALMVRRIFLKGIRYFDERLGEYLPEADLAIQIRRANRKILLLPAVRVTRLPAPRPTAATPSLGALLAADYLRAARLLVAKHYGWPKGLRFLLKSLFTALLEFRLALLWNLLNDRKVDGSQSEF